jgi:hypothetical protein
VVLHLTIVLGRKRPHRSTFRVKDAVGPGNYVAVLSVTTALGTTTIMRTVVVQ